MKRRTLKYARTIRLKGRTIILPDLPTSPRVVQGESGQHLSGERRKRHSLWRSGVRACYRCGGELLGGPDLCTLEHKVALAEGGENTLVSGNLSLSHYDCNTRHGGEVSSRQKASKWAAMPWYEKAIIWWQRSQYFAARITRCTYYRSRYRILRWLGWSDSRINGREPMESPRSSYDANTTLPVSKW